MKYLITLFKKIMLAIMVTISLLTAAFAQVSETTAQAVKSTIQAQLAAFAKDDGDLAFSYAAPNIRALFQTPQNFMAMVQGAYPVVYRPSKLLFLAASDMDSAVVQPVKMWDQNDRSWIATYKLERQADGRWLIDACVLVRDRASSNISLAY
jgi:ketosteroid isomerase-like protein